MRVLRNQPDYNVGAYCDSQFHWAARYLEIGSNVIKNWSIVSKFVAGYDSLLETLLRIRIE